MSQDLEIELAFPRTKVAEALAREAAAWGGEWRADEDGGGGQLALPVVYGLKRGVQAGRVELFPSAAGTRLHWRSERSDLATQRPAVVVLAVAAVSLLPALAWPFHPPLMALLPFGAVAGLLAWWAVISKLHTSGPRELLDELAKALADEDPVE